MPAQAGTIRYGTPAGRWLIAITVLGSGIAFLEATVVNVALPAIGEDLGADVAGLQWTINGYLLTLAALILIGGSLGDRYGRRRVFMIGVVWFTRRLRALLAGAEHRGADRRPRLPGDRRRPAHPGQPRDHRVRPSTGTTGPARSAPGRRSAASPAPSGRCSAAG